MNLWANFLASEWDDVLKRAAKTALQVGIALLMATNLAGLDVDTLETIGVASLAAGLSVINNALSP